MHPFSAALREIATIPGARYSCVADDATGEVLAEHGLPGPDPAAAVRWGSRLRAALRPSGELEDVMITAEETYHLLRLVRADSGTVLVHVSIDRTQGNLALARRALGDVRLTTSISTAPQRIEYDIAMGAPGPAVVGEPRTPTRAPLALPVRTPRRPDPPIRRPGATLSAVPPPRRPVVAEIVADAVAQGTAAPEQEITVPEARGWSDDLYTMGRLLDALRRMK